MRQSGRAGEPLGRPRVGWWGGGAIPTAKEAGAGGLDGVGGPVGARDTAALV